MISFYRSLGIFFLKQCLLPTSSLSSIRLRRVLRQSRAPRGVSSWCTPYDVVLASSWWHLFRGSNNNNHRGWHAVSTAVLFPICSGRSRPHSCRVLYRAASMPLLVRVCVCVGPRDSCVPGEGHKNAFLPSCTNLFGASPCLPLSFSS